VIWTGEDGALHVRRVSASGQLGDHVRIADAGGENTRVAVARDGSAWVLWIDEGDAWTARLTPAGAIDGGPVRLSDSGAGFADVVAGADGAVAFWTTAAGADDKALISRLSAGGAVAGPAIEVAPAIAERSRPDAALLPGGAIDVVYQPPAPGAGGGGTPFTPSYSVLRRVAPDGALGVERRLAATGTTLGSAAPRISAGSDGSATVTWLDVSSDDLGLVGFQQRPDGTTTAPRTITRGFLMVFGLLASDGGDITQLATSRLGVATAAWREIGERTATIATARHRYANPGTYTVTVTVVDGAGNETTVSRPLTVVAPPPTATRASAALKLGKVTRKGAKVTVTGRLDRRASGTVTVAYSQRIGRRSRSTRVTAKIARGRFTATLRLTGALARARGGKATVKVSYAGDDDTNAGSARRTVNVPKAKPKKDGAKKAKPKRGKSRGEPR